MTAPLRNVKLSTGHTLTIWDANTQARTGQHQLSYEMVAPDGRTLFEGADCGVSPMHSIDSDAALLGLLGYLTLRPGDTDSDYFDNYTDAQREWSESSACESLQCETSGAEEDAEGECACAIWENLDGWTCDDEQRGTIADFEVLDHGEDGSQYFPGCGVANTRFQYVTTGVGDTGAEALDDALEQMAMSVPSARPSKLQAAQMRRDLSNPDKSANASLDHTQCDEDHSGDDWSHWVSVRYNVREGA